MSIAFLLMTGCILAQELTPLGQVATFLKALAQQIEDILAKQEKTKPEGVTTPQELTDASSFDTAEIQEAVISSIAD